MKRDLDFLIGKKIVDNRKKVTTLKELDSYLNLNRMPLNFKKCKKVEERAVYARRLLLEEILLKYEDYRELIEYIRVFYKVNGHKYITKSMIDKFYLYREKNRKLFL